MKPQQFNRSVCRVLLSTALLASLGCSLSSRAELLWGTMQRSGLDMTLVIDKTAGKICMQTSGPSSYWFGWGFGQPTMSGYALVFNTGSAPGNYFETTMDYGFQPSPQAQQNATASYIVTGSAITYTVFRDLNTGDPNDYKDWAVGGANYITWALGTKPFNYHDDRNAETITIASASAPKLSGIQHNHDAGSTTLTLQNLSPAATNKIEFISSLGTTNWTTISNIVFSPLPGGPSLSSFMTGLSVAVANNNTNADGFYRLRQ